MVTPWPGFGGPELISNTCKLSEAYVPLTHLRTKNIIVIVIISLFNKQPQNQVSTDKLNVVIRRKKGRSFCTTFEEKLPNYCIL